MEISPYAAKQDMQRHAVPLADLAPALDTNVPRDLAFLRQRKQLLERPGCFVGDAAGDIEAPLRRHAENLPFRIICIEAERFGDRARRIGFGKTRGAE